ncbi:MAG: FMN-binding protein [Kibdelosporangium sp.]
MRKAIPAIVLTAVGFVLVWQYQPETTSAALALPPPSSVPALPAPGTGSSGAPAQTRTVSGSQQTNPHGVVQVEVTFTGDRITDVQFLKLPNTGPSRQAAPILRQETLRAQNANVDTVSGATQTSESYLASLQAAIDAKG